VKDVKGMRNVKGSLLQHFMSFISFMFFTVRLFGRVAVCAGGPASDIVSG